MARSESAAIAELLADGFTSIDVHDKSTFAGAMIESVNRLHIDRTKRSVATTLTEITATPGEAIVLQHYSMTSSPDAPLSMPKMLQTLSIDTWRDVDGAWLLARTHTRELEVVGPDGRRRFLKNLKALGDESLLRELHDHGSDLSKPTDIVFYLYIPDKNDANAAASELRTRGFQSDVGAPLGKFPNGATGNRWSVISHLTAIPTVTAIYSASMKMEKLADRYSGEFDGWEAAVQE